MSRALSPRSQPMFASSTQEPAVANLSLDVPSEVTTGWVGDVVEDSSSESSRARP